MKHLFLFLFCFFLLSLAAEAAEKKKTPGAQPGSGEVMVRMDDGTQLATDVYLPSKKGKVPAVLVRTPYNKASEAWMEKGFHKLGIAAVVQDCRGKYNSKGEFSPFINERADGLATLRWIRSQPWSDGTVAGWGGSYVGYTQWAISDSLDFLTPLLTGASLYDLIYPDDMFSLHLAFLWGFLNASATANPIPPEKIYAGMNMLPLSAADDSVIKDLGFMNDWLSHQSYDSYWKKLDHKAITSSPLVSIAGWYDIFLEGQINDFQALEKSGNHSGRLVIGPWCHGNPGEKNDYGGKKKTGEPGMILKYMKDFLDGKELKLKSPLKDEKYNLFIMERNEYAGSDVWPPRETRITPFYLTGGSSLDTLPPRENGSTVYHYDPADPYPSIGGTILGAAVGPARQNPNTGRKDQQVFTRPVGDKPLVLLGPLSATLWLSSQVKCTDFVVCIQDEFPDGKIINIQEGAAHVTFSGQGPEKKEISVWATGYQLNPGHRLRVVITSSWFPRYNRSLNTCDPLITARDMKGADQTIWFGASEPSSVNLPVYQIK